jgi:hypothetical protein
MVTKHRHLLKAEISEQALLSLHDAPDDFGGKLLIRSDSEALLHAGSEEVPLRTRNRHHGGMSAWANKCKRALRRRDRFKDFLQEPLRYYHHEGKTGSGKGLMVPAGTLYLFLL